LLLTVALFVIGTPLVFADNPLQNTSIHAQSGVITLDVSFGQDVIKQTLTKTMVTPQIDTITLTFYGDEIDMRDSYLKVYGEGRLFSIKNIEQGVVMYGVYHEELKYYKINIYYATSQGLTKFTVSSDIAFPEEKVIESGAIKVKTTYIPELLIVPSHDYTTYWKQDFDIDVRAFDSKINPTGTGFNGKLNNVEIITIISLGDEVLATLKGVTEHGIWSENHYIKENLVNPGEYTVDVLASYNNQTISQSSSMFIIGSVVGGGSSSNHTPVAIASADDTTPTHPDTVTLDGTSSTDSDGDTLTYSWIIQSGLGSLTNENTSTATYTTAGATTVIIQLTVTDPKGKSSTDIVTITVS